MMGRLLRRLGLPSATVVAGLVVYNSLSSNLPSRAGKQTTLAAERDRRLYRNSKSSESPKKLAVPVPSSEEPAWLTEARNDPDPRVRLNAIEAWARNPGESLDPITYALVDPDEQVRARAQELLEEELAGR